MSDIPRIEKSILIQRPVADVFAAWASSDAMASWFAPMAESRPAIAMDFRVGGDYRIEICLPDGEELTTCGVFREIILDKKIVMTWHCDAFADPESIVTVEFSKSSAGTLVQLTHEYLESEATRDNHTYGWIACLDELQNVLEAS